MSAVSPFFVLALPRSRTAWLSEFLSYPPKSCAHDIGAESSSVQDFIDRLSLVDGTCETGAVVGWKLIRRIFPQSTIIVIKRPIRNIARSLARHGITPVHGELQKRRAMLDECSSSVGVLSFDFQDLNERSVCKRIFETCLRTEFDPVWYRDFAERNIQVDVSAKIERLRERQPFLTGLKDEVSAMIWALEGGSAANA